MQLRDFKNASDRRKALEKKLRINLGNIGKFVFSEERIANRNIENLLGAAQVPMGVAGPLKWQMANGKWQMSYLPLATTEGALVASVSRGCKAITEAGGANVAASRAGTTRGPVFYTGSLVESRKLVSWIQRNEKTLKKAAESTSSHLALKKAFVKSLADHVFVRFAFDTGDAMGMNMVTIATEKMVEVIEKETGMACLSAAGNFDIDKKPAWLNMIKGRGFEVWAEAVLPKKVIASILKSDPNKLYNVWYAKCMLGSALSGSLGFNAHFANVVAALYIATGQDPAHVVEGSHGITTMRLTGKGDLFVSVYLPSIMVGTVGGGTALPTQKEALQILGVTGKTEEFVAIVGGAVLAGEISLLASLAERSLGKAHERLGRGKMI